MGMERREGVVVVVVFIIVSTDAVVGFERSRAINRDSMLANR